MLLRHDLRREIGSLLGWALSLPILVIPMMGLYRLMMGSDALQELNRMISHMPPTLQAVIGTQFPLSTLSGWLQSQVFGFLVPLLFTLYTALRVLSVLTREIEGKTIEFLLALPVGRSRLLLSRLGGIWMGLAALHVVMLFSVVGGVRLIGEQPDTAQYALVLLNQYLVYAALAALLVLISLFIDDLQKGMMINISVGLAMFFLPRLMEAESAMHRLTKLSLFAYYQPGELLANRALPGGDVAVLLGALLVATGGALWLFGRKQISA